VSTNQCIPIKNTLGSSAVVLFACDIIQLFSLVFYVVKAAHKFDFTPVIKKKLINGYQWKVGHAVIETHVFYRVYVFFPDRRLEC
jgi:hypothetical protein